MFWGLIFYVNMGGLDKPKQAFHIIAVAKYKFSGNIEKNDAKCVLKAIDYFGSIGSDF